MAVSSHGDPVRPAHAVPARAGLTLSADGNRPATTEASSPEWLVSEVWSEVLGTNNAHAAADFLAQGGDSLLAMRLLSRINERSGLSLPPTTVLQTPRLDALTARVRDALAHRRVSRHRVDGHTANGTTPGQPATLSFSEERMWFMHELAPQSIAYNIGQALRLRGRLDVAALRHALDQVVARHEALRTTFVRSASGAKAVVSKHLDADFSDLDIRTGGAAVDPERVRRRLGAFVRRPFDLTRHPLLRVALFRIGPDDAVLLTSMHHIIGDQWSFDVFARDLADAYNARRAGNLAGPSSLQPGYRQYAQWHRRWFLKQRHAVELEYWRERLADLEPTTLAVDRPRPPQQSFRGARLRLALPAQDTAALTAVAGRYRSTLAAVLLTALFVLLHRYTGNQDIAIGMPVANRQHPGAEPLIGTLVNTLVLRADLTGEPDFATLLTRVREGLHDALAHQDAPFELLVQELNLTRDPGRPPLFGVMFNMLNTPLGELRFDGLEWSRFEFDRGAAQFDLTLHVDTEHDRSVVFEYATDLFTRDTVRRLANHWQRLLRAIIDGEHQRPIAHLPMLSGDELELLERWGRGPSTALPAETLAALLGPALRQHAGSGALSCGNSRMTYADLDRAAQGLAEVLRARGIGRGQRVGLCVQRSIALVVAQLAVMRAGAAWVPLDPTWPRERLDYMLEDAGLELVLTDSGSRAALARQAQSTLELDANGLPTQGAQNSGEPQTWSTALDAGPEDPAYVIYTSGSTGRPKGVVVPQRAVVNFLCSMTERPGLAAGDRLLAVTTPSFDISVLELLLPLATGAETVIAETADVTDGRALTRLLNSHEITLMQATPSTWHLLLETGWPGRRSLRALVGGETLSPELGSRLLARCAEVWNMYGPTETTVWSSCWRVSEPLSTGVSLGAPVANTIIRILDERLRPCPIGVPGEICIGGAGLASGYLHRAELTAERFVTNPADPEEPLYRTGDRGRWRHDGRLEHFGRLDFQVKVRGHRIEPGEIEAQLLAHPELAGAVVTTANDGDESRLLAYVAPWNRMPGSDALRHHLGQWLPDYMIPQQFVELDAIPLLPNGKVDRQRLPAASAHQPRGVQAVPPRTDLEHALWRIWQNTLSVSGFGVYDNFFDLGGHSMLAVRVVDRIREELGHRCSLPTLFRHPTVATLADALLSSQTAAGESLVPLQPLGELPPLFCICGIHLYQALADCFAPRRPVYGVFVAEEMHFVQDPRNNLQAPGVKRLAAAYLRTIRARRPQGPYHLIGFSFGGIIAYEMAQQLCSQGQSVELLCVLDSDLPGEARYGLGWRFRQILRRFRRHISPGTASTPDDASTGGDDDETIADRSTGYLAAMRHYRAAPYDGLALFIEATDAGDDTSWGWNRLANRLRIHRVSATHLGLLQTPAVDEVAQLIGSTLDAAGPASHKSGS